MDRRLRLALEKSRVQRRRSPGRASATAGTYFARCYEWRGPGRADCCGPPGGHTLVPHLVVPGAGGDIVVSRSPFMADDTEPDRTLGRRPDRQMVDGWQLRVGIRGVDAGAVAAGALRRRDRDGFGAKLGSPADFARPRASRDPDSPAAAERPPRFGLEAARSRAGAALPDLRRATASPASPIR